MYIKGLKTVTQLKTLIFYLTFITKVTKTPYYLRSFGHFIS